jgi:hypothetical protein
MTNSSILYNKSVSQGASVDNKIGKISKKVKKDEKGRIQDRERRKQGTECGVLNLEYCVLRLRVVL